MKKAAGKLAAAFGDRLAADIKRPDVIRWLDSLDMAPASRDNYLAYARLYFTFAVDHGYSQENPVIGIRKTGIEGEIGILSVEQAKALLAAAPIEMVPYYALGLFVGLRPHSEIERLKWEDFDWPDRLIHVRN